MNAPYTLKLEAFEGPLDLLLQLVERRQLDITRVSLAAVADQYLAYLTGLDRADLDAWSSFIIIGSRLLLLKSASLLPVPPAAEEEADAEELVQMLEAYRRYKAAAEELRTRLEAGRRSYPRPAPLAPPPRPPRLVGVTPADLARALERALARVDAGPTETVPRRTLTVQNRIARLEDVIRARGRVTFDAFVGECRSRTEVIVSFLALLELLKRGVVQARQATLFGEIIIEAYRPERENDAGAG